MGAQQPFDLGGRRWSLRVPQITTSTEASDLALRIVDAALRFTLRGEQVERVEVQVGRRVIELERRGHHQLIGALGRLRAADRERGVDDFDAGWIDHPALQERLGCTRNFVNVNVHRARKQLEKLGFIDAACLIERRARSGQLRLGVRDIEIESIAG